MAQKSNAFAQQRLERSQHITVAAAAQLRDLRAQLLGFGRILLAPQLGIETLVDVGEEFSLIPALRFCGRCIEMRDRLMPGGRELAVGGGKLGIVAGGKLACRLGRVAIERGLSGACRRCGKCGHQQRERKRQSENEHHTARPFMSPWPPRAS